MKKKSSKMSEEEAIQVVLRSMQEAREGKVLRGDLDMLKDLIDDIYPE